MADKTPLVTVAVSVYNVVEFINESLDCIEQQSYKNIEILCIDDCSTDSTYEIIKGRAAKDKRYHIIRQSKNQGLSVSRNLAIAEAKGDYIIMVDGDDKFSTTMVEESLSRAMESHSDMVLWDYATFSSDEELRNNLSQSSSLTSLDASDKTALLRRPAFMWVRLLRLETLRKSGIHFTPGLTKQDIPIHWQLVTSLHNISILPKKLSYYRIQPNATSCQKGKSVFSLAIVMDLVYDYLKASGLYETYRCEYLRSRLSLLHGMYDFILPEYKKEALAIISQRYDEEAQAYLQSNECELKPRIKSFYQMLDGSTFGAIKYKSVILCRSIYRTIRRFL